MYKKSQSLKRSLVVPYAVLVLMVSAVLSATYYFTAISNVKQFRQQHITASTHYLQGSLQRFLHDVTHVIEAAFPVEMQVANDINQDAPSMRQRAWIATLVTPDQYSYVYYGNELGQYYGLKRIDDTLVEERSKFAAEQTRQYLRYRGIEGVPELVHTERDNYDPRTRPWYHQAKEAESNVWTPVYMDYSSQDLMITKARRTVNAAGEFNGAVATDIKLKDINAYLAEVNTFKQNSVFLIDADGSVIAFSGDTDSDLMQASQHCFKQLKPQLTDGKTLVRLYNDFSEPVLVAAQRLEPA